MHHALLLVAAAITRAHDTWLSRRTHRRSLSARIAVLEQLVARLEKEYVLALPEATLRWEWKWFRQAFVYVGVRVVEHANRVVVRLTRSHRWLEEILRAHDRLRSLAPAF